MNRRVSVDKAGQVMHHHAMTNRYGCRLDPEGVVVASELGRIREDQYHLRREFVIAH